MLKLATVIAVEERMMIYARGAVPSTASVMCSALSWVTAVMTLMKSATQVSKGLCPRLCMQQSFGSSRHSSEIIITTVSTTSRGS